MKNNSEGLEIIDDFLPKDVAQHLERLYVREQEWEHIDQVRESYYQHVFKNDSDYFPKEDEYYLAKFDRSRRLEVKIAHIFKKYFEPKLIEFSQKKLLEFDTRCYKLDHEDFYRTHVDDYAGTVGCVYYLNKRWCWDWGGILHIGERDDELTSIFPKFNRIVIHDMKKFIFNHFISPVTNYAKQSRYSIVSFNK